VPSVPKTTMPCKLFGALYIALIVAIASTSMAFMFAQVSFRDLLCLLSLLSYLSSLGLFNNPLYSG